MIHPGFGPNHPGDQDDRPKKKNQCVCFPLSFFLGASIILAIILANWRFYPGIILPAIAEAPSSWPTPFNHPAALSRFAVFF